MNNQKTEKAVFDKQGNLDVHSVWLTIQGEGPFAGCPSVFVRLAGCNLQCNFCDTDYTSNRKNYSPDELLTKVIETAAGATGLVVITGGEPFRQNIQPFILALRAAGCDVQIETNGTLCPQQFLWDSCLIVCSPKTAMINPEMAERAHFYKYIVEAGKICPEDGLPLCSLGMGQRVARPPEMFRKRNIFVQPLDSKDNQTNDANTRYAVGTCLQFGYRLCLQVHKYVNVD